MEGNNLNEKIAFLRDTFLSAEKEYLEELMKDERYKEWVKNLSGFNSKRLFLEAINRINDIETGKIKAKNLEKVETEIVIILASIQNYVRVKMEREKNKDDDDLDIDR